MLHVVVTAVCVISGFHMVLGLISVVVGIISSIKAEVWLAHSVSPIWSGGFFIITGILGIFCARRKTSYVIMCFTAFSVVSMVTAVVSIQLLRLGLVNHTTDGHTFQKADKDTLIIVALSVAGSEILVCLLSTLLSCRMAKVAKEELCKRREGMFHVKVDNATTENDVTVGFSEDIDAAAVDDVDVDIDVIKKPMPSESRQFTNTNATFSDDVNAFEDDQALNVCNDKTVTNEHRGSQSRDNDVTICDGNDGSAIMSSVDSQNIVSRYVLHSEIRCSGFQQTACDGSGRSQSRDGGVTFDGSGLSQSRDGGVTFDGSGLSQSRDGGVTFDGSGLSQSRDGGVTFDGSGLSQSTDGGVKLYGVRDGDVSLYEGRDGGVTLCDASDGGITLCDARDGGVTLCDARDGGVTLGDGSGHPKKPLVGILKTSRSRHSGRETAEEMNIFSISQEPADRTDGSESNSVH